MVTSESMLLTLSHIWVHGLILDRVYVDVQDLCHVGSMEELNLIVCVLESWPNPSPAVALRRCDLTPPLTWAKQDS